MIISIFKRKKEKKKLPMGSKTSKNNAMHGKQDAKDNPAWLGVENQVSKSAAKDQAKKRASPASDAKGTQDMIGVGSTSSGATPASDAKDMQDTIGFGNQLQLGHEKKVSPGKKK